MLTTLAVANYRSINQLVVPLARLNLITGPNGSGKSNLYRALRLLAETARGGVINAVARGSLSIEKLEAMTCVCSVGLDMIAIAGDTSASTISGIIADEAAIGMINNKTTAVRVIPVPGKKVGDSVEFGGLLGYCPIVPVKNEYSSAAFIARGGRIPAPIRSLTN